MRSIINSVVEELDIVLANVSEDEAIQASNYLQSANRIFVWGEGRSGLMGKAFAMRLMHGGYEVYVIGETITPSIEKNDLFVAISGSGSTGNILDLVKKAKKTGAKVIAVTTNGESETAQLSDQLLIIPAATKYRRSGEPDTIQPLGNQFDQCVHLLLDAIIIHCLQEQEVDSHENMRNRHANLE
ncbi:6-phospho-3-hexuloisomerase [Jeotgalibacillus soli]|uniref:SIS domain-containing protein n=1 Tax=Jeotgalibacillus soli TaxID=889306 RepID=A0A0C2RNR3_9BACL|nr:6-phospho-3-hexuloisomerase [Jeotgalibacillus soli]KIL51915.1 hypothetical protein KP78_02850 [Jeotgalibacillus soli]